jgi:acetylornithine/succinyldiaminopimelate/putrescine aminotransferase
VVSAAQEGGLLANAVCDDAIRLAPSLLVADAEIDLALGILDAALSGDR